MRGAPGRRTSQLADPSEGFQYPFHLGELLLGCHRLIENPCEDVIHALFGLYVVQVLHYRSV